MRIVTPEDSEYLQDKAILNARISSNPAAILYCSNEQDVITAIKLARENKNTLHGAQLRGFLHR